MSRPMVRCGHCGAILRRNEEETDEARVTRHVVVGACHPPQEERKVKKPRSPSLKTTLGQGWDA